MTTMTHHALRLNGEFLTTSDGSFEDLAEVETPIGWVGFCRATDGWTWNLVTTMRAPDDFDDVRGGGGHALLEDAVLNAQRTLSPLFKLVQLRQMLSALRDEYATKHKAACDLGDGETVWVNIEAVRAGGALEAIDEALARSKP